MQHWLEGIDWTSKTLPDLALYVSGFLGLALLPASFGRRLWWLLGGFLLLNAAFLWPLGDFDWRAPWAFAILGQLPWMAFVLDLCFRGRLAADLAAVPLRSLLRWQIVRLGGAHFLLAMYGGYAPMEFALEAGFSEITTGAGALALFALYRPDRKWYQIAVVFWNAYGLIAALSAEYKILLSNPRMPFACYSREIFQYATGYPQSWVYAFGLPAAIAMHAAVFYKMYFTLVKEAEQPGA